MMSLNLGNLVGVVLYVAFVGAIPLYGIAQISESAAWIFYGLAVSDCLLLYNHKELKPKMLSAACSHLDRGGADLEWHGWNIPLRWKDVLPYFLISGGLLWLFVILAPSTTIFLLAVIFAVIFIFSIPVCLLSKLLKAMDPSWNEEGV